MVTVRVEDVYVLAREPATGKLLSYTRLHYSLRALASYCKLLQVSGKVEWNVID